MKKLETPSDVDWNRFWERPQSKKYGRISWSKKRILQIIEPHMLVGKNALDAGCGSGFFARYFCDRGMNTLALDYSQSALDFARQQTAGQAELIKADLVNDDLSCRIQKRCNLIFSDGLLEHFQADEQDKIIRNLVSVLHDEGVIVTFVPNRWSPWEIIRPLYMPGIEEDPFVMKDLLDVHQRNGLTVMQHGGINTLPFRLSPEHLMAARFGMLLYVIAKKKVPEDDAIR